MYARSASAGCRFFLLAVLFTLGGLAVGTSSGQDKEKPAQPSKEKEKTTKFTAKEKPWRDVWDWLAELTGKPVITVHAPTGSFTFIGPKDKEYTIPQVIDIINEALLSNSATQKYYLINRERSFTLIPADEKIDMILLPRLKTVEDLSKHGDTELVSLVLELKVLVADDVAPQIKKMMGPFSEAIPMTHTGVNNLILVDTVGNLKMIVEMVKKIEDGEQGTGGDSYSKRLDYIRVHDMERILKDLLGDPAKLMAQTLAADTPRDPRFGGGGGGDPRFGGGGGGGDPRFGGGGDPRAGRGAVPALGANNKRIHNISGDESSNTIYVNGPPDKVALAKKAILEQDVEKPGQTTKIPVGPPILKTYTLSNGNADKMAQALIARYKETPSVTIVPGGNNQIIVYAYPHEQIDITRILSLDDNKPKAEFVDCGRLESSKVADTLRGMFGTQATSGLFVEANVDNNSVTLRGPAELVGQAKAIIMEAGGGAGGLDGGNMRVFTLPNGGASALGDMLQQMLPKIGHENPVELFTPGGSNTVQPKSAPPPKQMPPPKPDNDRSSKVFVDPTTQRVTYRDEPGQPGQPQKKQSAPIRITALGNKLYIQSEDKEALRAAQELIQFILRSGNDGDFEIIKLKNANAVDAAKVLDEAFNGKAQPQQQRNANPFQPQVQQTPARTDVIRVVADSATNSLLIKASPLDMLRIRRLLASDIDNDSDSPALNKPRIVRLKYANASDVADILRNVYHDQTGAAARGGQVNGFRGFGFPGLASTSNDSGGAVRPTALQLGIDDRSNSLVLNCADNLYEEIKTLCKDIDDDAKDRKGTIRIVRIDGIDPGLLEQAISAVQGNTLARRNTNTQGGNNNNGNFNSIGGNGGFPGNNGYGGGNYGGGGFQNGYGTGGAPGGGPGGNGFGRGQGGGGPGAAGGFSPGGNGPGGNGPGGNGGGPNGNGGTRGGGRGGRGGMSSSIQGPDFFADRVTDDPKQAIFFDPLQATDASSNPDDNLNLGATPNDSGALQPINFEQAQQPMVPAIPTEVEAPQRPVQIEALPELGIIVVRSQNPQDAELIEQLIKIIREHSAQAEVDIRLVPLEKGDATSITNILTQLFQRVIVQANGNSNILGAPRQTQTTGGILNTTQVTTLNQPSSIGLFPIPRLNAILVAAPRSRMEYVVTQIRQLDVNDGLGTQLHTFQLTQAGAARVAQLLNLFWSTRYPNELSSQHQIRISFDDPSNTIIVQAAPADLTQIAALIDDLDHFEPKSVNQVVIVPLVNAIADDLAQLILKVIGDSIVTPTSPSVTQPSTTGTPTTTPVTPGGNTPNTGAPGTRVTGGYNGTGPATSKSQKLQFMSADGHPVEAGLLEDIHITADQRTNVVLVSAPPKVMEMVLTIIKEMDAIRPLRADIRIFPLKKGDANTMISTLQNLFQSSSVSSTRTTLGSTTGSTGSSASTFNSGIVQGAPLVDLRLSADPVTNSIIVAGSPRDIVTVEALIYRLEASGPQERRNEVYQLRNAIAADTANTLTTFFNNAIAILKTNAIIDATQDVDREIVIVPDPITNKLLISCTPRFYPEVMRLVQELDSDIPQVVIQVLVAEVDLSGSEEFGVEIGLQTPVLFNRSIYPGQGVTSSTSTFAVSTTGASTVPSGVGTSGTIPVSNLGYLFNNPIQGLGNNIFNGVSNPALIGYQGLTSLGVGRVSPANNAISGFVFSASSDTFSLLVRALKTQGRLDVLSRPQVQTLDNQSARVFVGQSFPIITGTTTTATGFATASVSYEPVGVELLVTPKIEPDGRVLMRVTPTVASAQATNVTLSAGITLDAVNQQTVDTTVIAQDGETVAIGGLITRSDNKNENKVPWLGDLPWIGTAFRFRTQTKAKSELLVIMTPHIVRGRADADQILATESKHMDWVVGDVVRMHGTSGMEPIYPNRPNTPPGQSVIIKGQQSEPLPAPTPLQPVPMPMTPAQPAPTTLPQQTFSQPPAQPVTPPQQTYYQPPAQPAQMQVQMQPQMAVQPVQMSMQPPAQPLTMQPQMQSLPMQPQVQPLTMQPPTQPLTMQPQVQPLTMQPQVQPMTMQPPPLPVTQAPLQVNPQMNPPMNPQMNAMPTIHVGAGPQGQQPTPYETGTYVPPSYSPAQPQMSR